MDHRGFRRAIDHRGREAGEPPRDAAVVDDAAGALFAHMGRGVLHAEHHAAHQGRHRGVEAADLEALDAAGLRRAAGIVEQAIDLAEFLHRKRDQRAHLVFLGDVRLAEDAIGAKLLRQRLAFRRAAAGDDDLRALVDKNLRRAQADAAGGARDDRDLAVEPSHVVIPHTMHLKSAWRAGTVILEPIFPTSSRRTHGAIMRRSGKRLFFASLAALIWIG